jgi:hypothetical protein
VKGSEGMSRLINTDDLLDQLGLEDTEDNREENIGEIITLEDLDRVPTAYDTDKIVEKFHEQSEYIGTRYMIDIETAIDIVKQGGVTE